MSGSPAADARRAPVVVESTAAGRSPEAAAQLVSALASTQVDPRIWTGAFATNVWGGRYAIDGVLGEGAQGTTFAGEDLKTGARIAVKLFDLGRARDWKAQELFEREVHTLRSVEHPGIPAFLDVIEDKETGARALVRALVPGESLAQVVAREGPLGEAALWRVVVDCADVLGALHGHPSTVVHRDLKPQNLIRRPDGKVCLVDFGGVGRVRDAAGSTVVGTFGFMAPEQLYGAQTPATDLYALGATILSLATGKQPEELPRKGLAFDVDRAAPRLSPQLRALLARLTAPDPSHRPADARALQASLQELSARPAAEPEVVESAGTTEPNTHNGADFLVGLVSLFVGVLGVAGAVLVGEILLPLALSILAVLSTSPQRKEQLRTAKRRVREAARLARGGFERSALHGAERLEVVGERERERKKRERRARKRREREDEATLREMERAVRGRGKNKRRQQRFRR